jgi:hypothetical protein
MTSEIPETAPPERRSSRAGEGGAPVSGALTIVLAVVAVVAGFLILRAITGDDDGGTTLPTGPGQTATTEPDGADDPDTTTPVTDPPPPTTTEPALVVDGATVVVANANGVNGSAGAMTDLLADVGYIMGEPTNATTGQLDSTVIYYDPETEAAQAVAESVNRSLGGDSSISQVGTPAPTTDGSIGGDVLVLLGNDKAGSTLEELAPAAGNEAETTVTAPEVSGEPGDDADPDADPDG